jgi:hypothetical protein
MQRTLTSSSGLGSLLTSVLSSATYEDLVNCDQAV